MKPIKELNINKMSVEQLHKLPFIGDNSIGNFQGLIILPEEEIHDSGFRCMDFVACKGVHPICRLSGCSDVIHIDGIGGFGPRPWPANTFPQLTEPKSWSIDCLPTSGLLRLFVNPQFCLTLSEYFPNDFSGAPSSSLFFIMIYLFHLYRNLYGFFCFGF